ncbi:MAG TPA: hypothetical protein VKA35_08690 [Solirubrobacterales bacterium]|nr:hypothetical protein [Solirubrobacterales bacterium]
MEPLPKVPDPGTLEEHGISIPAPTPTGIDIANPWAPDANPPTQHAEDQGNGGPPGEANE